MHTTHIQTHNSIFQEYFNPTPLLSDEVIYCLAGEYKQIKSVLTNTYGYRYFVKSIKQVMDFVIVGIYL